MIHPQARQRLKTARTDAGLSLRELGRRVGVSASLLSQIENGKSDPSVSSLYALVSEFGISLDSVMDAADDSTRAVNGTPGPTPGSKHRSDQLVVASQLANLSPIVGPGQRAVLNMDSGVRWERLNRGPAPEVDALLVTYQPGGSSSSSGQLMTHSGVEYAYLTAGELTLQLGFDTHLVQVGDSLAFSSSTPHKYSNLGSVPAIGVWFVIHEGHLPSGDAAVGSPHRIQAPLNSAVDVLDAFGQRR